MAAVHPRAVIELVRADWGRSDPPETLKTGQAMPAAGFTDTDVGKVLWWNPVGQSGRLMPDEPIECVETYAGNSVPRWTPR
ncbi:hypothetical protein [Actinokineospora sp. HUAS TT18]|uniref:hypothetical protein n=1 Tax=Actinokineospora sp. HUAS TT18 TaxID=3447451 RepID=UPI003F5213F8